VELLLAKDADINARDNTSNTALHIAAQKFYKDLAKLLPVRGAEVDYKINDGVTSSTLAEDEVTQLLLKNRAEVNAKNMFGYTPLHWAAQNGHKDIVELLLVKKAEIEAKDSVGRTPLYWAATKGHKDVVELLLANKAEVNAKSFEGLTPLHRAIAYGHKDVAELLRQHGGHE
jgi:ankyrin repeat protein